MVCRQLNYTGVLGVKKESYFGEGNGSIWLDDVHCFGNESSIIQCHHRRYNNCNHSEDVGVICSKFYM